MTSHDPNREQKRSGEQVGQETRVSTTVDRENSTQHTTMSENTELTELMYRHAEENDGREIQAVIEDGELTIFGYHRGEESAVELTEDETEELREALCDG